MKRIIGFGISVVALGALIFVPISAQRGKHESSSEKKAEALAEQLSKACQIFSEKAATTALGGQVEKSDDANAAQASSDDVAVSQCAYVQKLTGTVTPENQKRSSIVVRTSRTDSARQLSKGLFTPENRPAGSEQINGYGEAAFWNPAFGQLNILKDGNWYIIESGSQLPDRRTKAEAEKLADALKSQL